MLAYQLNNKGNKHSMEKYEKYDEPKRAEKIREHKINRKHRKVNQRFMEALFHPDYMDVATSFNNISPNQRQIFNITNVTVKVTKDSEISRKEVMTLNEILEEFVETVNKDIEKNVPLYKVSSSGWDEVLPENVPESGFSKQMKRLGLPPDLYNRPKLKTHVSLVTFSDITKYETDEEIRYTCKVILSKEKVKDQLVIKISIVIPKNAENMHLIVEEISVVGYMTEQGLGIDKIEEDNFYWFDGLEENNMLDGTTIAKELINKYNIREKDMQEKIDNLDEDSKLKYYDTPSQATYKSYQLTETIFDDMFGKNQFDTDLFGK